MLIEITSQSGFTHLHDEPKRENNLLDLIFTTNPTLAKAIVVTDIDTRPYYQKPNPRKSYIWAKADWEQVNQDLDTLTPNIQEMADSRSNINDIWNTFKQHLFKYLDKHIPSKIIKQQTTMVQPQNKENAQEKTEHIQPSKKN